MTSLAVLVATLMADQVTKLLIDFAMHPGRSVPASGVFRFTYVTNSGSAFGLFPNQTLFLIIASFVGIGVLLIFYRTHPINSTVLRISLGLQLGGAMGNLVDRVRLGYVIDFIDVGAWPVFNLADSAIVVGLIGLLWTLTSTKDGKDPAPGTSGEGVLLSVASAENAALGDVTKTPLVAESQTSEKREDPWE